MSKRGIVSTGYSVLFPSPDGLVMWDVSGARVITEAVYSRAQWQALNPSTGVGAIWEGLYMFSTSTGSILINPGNPGLGVISTTDVIRGALYDEDEDTTYVIVGDQLQKFADPGSAKRSLTWKSKVFELMPKINLATAQVRADAYPVTFTLTADGTQVHTRSVTSAEPFRMGGDYLASRFEVTLAGATGEPYEVLVGETMQDLRELG